MIGGIVEIEKRIKKIQKTKINRKERIGKFDQSSPSSSSSSCSIFFNNLYFLVILIVAFFLSPLFFSSELGISDLLRSLILLESIHLYPPPSSPKMITIPYLTALTTYFSYGLLFAFGQFRDFFRKIFDWWHASNLQVLLLFIFFMCFFISIYSILLFIYLSYLIMFHVIICCKGYAPICLGLEDFYIRRLYLRIQVSLLFIFCTLNAHYPSLCRVIRLLFEVIVIIIYSYKKVRRWIRTNFMSYRC